MLKQYQIVYEIEILKMHPGSYKFAHTPLTMLRIDCACRKKPETSFSWSKNQILVRSGPDFGSIWTRFGWISRFTRVTSPGQPDTAFLFHKILKTKKSDNRFRTLLMLGVFRNSSFGRRLRKRD